MTSKAIKRFSLKTIIIAMIITIAMSFGIPSSVFASPISSSNVGETLKLGTSSYEILPDDNGTPEDTSDDRKYVDLPEATISGGTLAITAKPVSAGNSQCEVVMVEKVPNTTYSARLYLIGDMKNYQATYVLTISGEVVTKTNVDVVIDSYSPTFSWLDNSQQIIPTQLNRSTSDKEAKIVFPYPYIYGLDSETPINVKTENNGTEATTEDDYETPEDATGLKVTLVGPNGANLSAFGKNTESGYYEWTIPTAKEDAPAGLYTVTYSYSADNSYSVKKEWTFEIITDEIETSLSISGYKDGSGSASVPSLMSLYVETTFPTPTVINTKASNAEVDVWTEISLKCVPTDTDKYGSEIIYDITNSPSLRELKFTPTVAGKYTLTYKVSDFFGNTREYQGSVNGITASKSSASGSGYIVAGYLGEDAGVISAMTEKAEKGTLQTVEDSIPSIVAKGSTWAIPALFGIDKANEYDELNFSRTVTFTEEGKTHTVTNVYSSTASGDYKKEAYEAIDYTFNNIGSYKFTFSVTDGSGHSLIKQYYTVEVEDGYADTTAPNLVLTGLSSVTSAGNTIVFTATATDYRTDKTDIIADERVNVVVQYQYNGDSEWTTLTAENGKYTIEVPKSQTHGSTLSIKATATDDYGVDRVFYDADTEVTTVIDATTSPTVVDKNINIRNYSEDNNAPTIGEFIFDAEWFDGTQFKTFKTGDIITLPTVSFNDHNPNLQVYAVVTCNDKAITGGTFSQYSGNVKLVSLGGETFIAILAGDYTVTYTATDVNGNKSITSFIFKVDGPQIPIVTLGTFNTSYEYGTEIDLTNVSITINTVEVNDIVDNMITNLPSSYSEEQMVDKIEEMIANAQASDPTNYEADKLNYGDIIESLVVQINGDTANIIAEPGKIVAGQSGKVTLKYWAISATGEFNPTPQTVTFSTQDTVKPVLIVNDGFISVFPGYDSSADADAEVNKVKIPNATATDLSGIQEVKITAKYESETKDLEIIEYAGDSDEFSDGYYGYFIANKHGQVVVTYTATDNSSNANTTTTTHTIGVGDISAPQISIVTLQDSLQKAYKLNDSLEIDLTKLVVTDEESLDYKNVDVMVTLDGVDITGEDISESDAGKMIYKLDKTGTYVITFDIEDTAGNAATPKTITITVASEISENTVSATVWGTILIIAALLIIGLIIYFFIKPTKVAKITKSESNKDDGKKEKKDKIQV